MMLDLKGIRTLASTQSVLSSCEMLPSVSSHHKAFAQAASLLEMLFPSLQALPTPTLPTLQLIPAHILLSHEAFLEMSL